MDIALFAGQTPRVIVYKKHCKNHRYPKRFDDIRQE